MENITNFIPKLEKREFLFEPLPFSINPYKTNFQFEVNIRKTRLEEIEAKLRKIDFSKESDPDYVKWFVSKRRGIKLKDVHLSDFKPVESEVLNKLLEEKNNLIYELTRLDHSFVSLDFKKPPLTCSIVLSKKVYNTIAFNKVFVNNLETNHSCKLQICNEKYFYCLKVQAASKESLDQIKQSIHALVSSYSRMKDLLKTEDKQFCE